MINDTVELLLVKLLFLETTDHHKMRSIRYKKSEGGGKKTEYDAGTLLRFDDMKPLKSTTSQIGGESDDRLYGLSPQYMKEHPIEIIGNQNEATFFGEDFIRWHGYRRISKPPKGLAVLGNYSAIYEHHFREMKNEGEDFYCKRVIAVDIKGNPLPVKMGKLFMSQPIYEGASFLLSCSVLEDAKRSNSILVTVEDGTSLSFPVDYADYKEVFSIRDAPLSPTGKKKKIIHWVSSHLRKTKNKETKIKTHTSGVCNISVDGLSLTLTPNAIHK